jgi:5'-nucleotidase
VPNDLALALALNALSPRAQQKTPIAHTHGADLLLGGHDHLYFVSKGADVWHNFDLAAPVLGAEADDGRALVVKSGTDFRDLSAFALTLADAPPGSVRRRLIARIEGRHLETRPDGAKSEALQALLKDVLADVGKSLGAPVAKTAVPLDVRSHLIRTAESAAANWFAVRAAPRDVCAAADTRRARRTSCTTRTTARCACRAARPSTPCSSARACCAATACMGPVHLLFCPCRSPADRRAGDITLGDILEILPFEDPLVVLELPGAALWAALEASLSTWPAQEGRFPVLAGARVRWDSRKPRGERVLSVTLLREKEGGAREEVDVARDDTHYVVLTREYMAQGHDGFTALQGHKYLVDDESGQMMSAIVRKYLLGRPS